MAINDITGDEIRSRGYSTEAGDNFDRIFKKGKYAVEAQAIQHTPQAVGGDSEHGSLPRHCDCSAPEQCTERGLHKRPEAKCRLRVHNAE